MNSSEKKKYDELLAEYKTEALAQFHWIRWKCMTDLFFLGTEILGLDKAKGRVYPKFHRWLCQILQQENDKLILIPRKHTKTTWVEVRIIQELLIAAGRIRVLMLSKTERIVTDSLTRIKRHLSRPLLRRYFPEVIPDPGKDYKGWFKSTANELRMKEDIDWIAKEPQIMALGSAASFTGSAVDRIYLDDYIDDDTCRSVTKMQKAEDDWRYLQPILDVGGYFCVTGTFYHYNDLYNLIIREGHIPRKFTYIRKAIENGVILYPTIFTQKKLDSLRKIEGNYIFSCQYMLDPIPKDDQIFPGPQPTCVALPAVKYRYFIMMDPAPTTNQTSDSTGFAVAAINKLKQVFFVEAFSVKKDGKDKADMLIQKCIQYQPERVGIEYGLQKDLDYIIKTKTTEYENFNHVHLPMLHNVIPIKISNQRTKADRIYHTLGQFVRAGKVLILESKCRELLQQMDVFTGRGREKDDVVDAASMLFPLVEEFGISPMLAERLPAHPNSFFNVFKKKSKTGWRSNFVA